MKLLVMGYSGAGKSTLARALGEQYGCPVLHLDTVQFRENWQERDAAESEALVEAFLNGNPGWVIDGNYLGRFSFERRCREADRIIQLLLPRHLCLYRVIKRYVQHRGTVRESMAAGCEEKIDWEFIRWILWEGRASSYRQGYRAIQMAYPGKVLVCTSSRAAGSLPCLMERGEPV